MNKRLGLRPRVAGLITFAAAAATAVLFAGGASAIVAGAGFTTDDPGFTPGAIAYAACLNGASHTTPGVNCNLYASKDDVWLNGGPTSGNSPALTDGTYFFAVLAPSGQQNPNDGSSTLLSSDAYTEREFTVSGGQVTTYLGGTHVTDSQYQLQLGLLINLMPYADTPNPGGVYIMAICQINPLAYDPVTSPVAPSSCKYDAFKAPASDCTENCNPEPFGALSGEKYYDANTDGQLTPGEAGISGWKITLHDGVNETLTTDTSGFFTESNLAPDTYYLSEKQPTNQKCVTEVIGGVSTLVCSPIWMQTGNTVNQSDISGATGSSVTLNGDKTYTVNLGDTGTVSGLLFGNVCVGGGGGLTLGYWSNKNGQAAQFSNAKAAATLAFLVSLNLRNANGSSFDPTTYTQFRTWLLGATATNMAYMLSAQLSAMELNVRNGNVVGTSLVYAPGALGANSNGFISVNDLLTEANAELGLHGSTLSGSPYRAYQEALKTALDRANNNLNFVESGPSGCPAPAFAP
jgi:hypothetical protein